MIPLTKPFFSKEDSKVLTRVLKNKNLTDGFYQKQCEGIIKEKIKSKFVALTHSCTAALEISAILLNLKKGDEMGFQVLRDGKAVSNQLVYASYAGFHGHLEDGSHEESVTTRTDNKGFGKIKFVESGEWYLRLIHMVKSDKKDIDYESNWATITFYID